MGKIWGTLAVIGTLALVGCGTAEHEAAPAPAIEQVVHISTEKQATMLDELRPHLVKLDASDAALYREAYESCANLLVRDKDSYRDAVLKQYGDLELALDHLAVAAAAKKYICP